MLSFVVQCARRGQTRTRPEFLIFLFTAVRVHTPQAHRIREVNGQHVTAG